MRQIYWSHPAIADLHEIDSFIARDNPAAADRVVEEIRLNVERLRDFPLLGHEGLVSGTRELVVPLFPYVISYRLRGEAIEVLAILHAERDRARALAERLPIKDV